MPPLMVRVGISDQPGDPRHCMYLSRTYSCQARFLTARDSHSLVLCLSGPTPSAMVKQLKQWTHINETEFKILGNMRRQGWRSKDIQAVLDRSKSWVSKNTKRLGKTMVKKFVQNRPGPKKTIGRAELTRLLQALDSLQKPSRGLKEVTVLKKCLSSCFARFSVSPPK